MKNNYIYKLLLVLVLILFFIGVQSAFGQQQFATSVTSESHVDFSQRAIDGNLFSSAVINANSGLILGAGAFSGQLELQFPNQLAANEKSYIRLDTEDDLLPFLLGGSLGGLLADIAGVVILGNQEFSIDVKNNETSVLQGDSSIANSFTSNALHVVTNDEGDFFISVSPNLPYNRIQIENRVGSLVGLNTQKEIKVYEAFTADSSDACMNANYTSFDGTGVTLDLLELAGAGVENPEYAIDEDESTYSEIGLGVVSVAASMNQTFYFDSSSSPEDVFYISLGIDPSLLQLGVLNNIQISADNGSSTNVFSNDLSNLLDLDLLGLLTNSGRVTVPIRPGVSIDRLVVNIRSLLGVSLDQKIRVYDIYSAPSVPIIDIDSENVAICSGSSASLFASTENPGIDELLWYDAKSGGNLLAVVGSGESFDTDSLISSTTYYVAARKIGCTAESPRVPVSVTVNPMPTADDIEVITNDVYCSSNSVVLAPTSTISGAFEWFFDSNASSQITDNMVDGDITYNISNSGTLTITGLDAGSSPYNYFIRLRTVGTDCTNGNGDLKEVNVTVLDSDFLVGATLDTVLTLQDILDVNSTDSTILLAGSVTGDANEGDSVTIRINNLTFTGVLDANLEYKIDVPGIDILADIDHAIELIISTGLCSVTKQLPILIPELPTEDLLQVFCASDNPTLLDLQLSLEDSVFFDALVGGNLLGNDTPLIDGGVYFSGLLNLPVNVFPRVAISVQIIEADAPTAADSIQTFCVSTSPVIGDLQVDQNEVVFYDSAVDGNMLNPNDSLVAGDYFVSRIENGCESEDRLQITAFIVEESPITLIGQTEGACISTESYTYFTESDQANYEWTVTGGIIIEGGTAADDFVRITWSSLQEAAIEVTYLSSDICKPNKGLITNIETKRCGEVLGEEFCLKVYNEFSPNSDGFNDFFEVECITDYSNSVRVYNRNGNLVFETKNYQNDWNGIATVSGVLNKGDHLPAGTYYYVINIPELNRDLVGWLHLAR